MLRLQQYEILIKTIVAHHELTGPASDLLTNRDRRVREAAKTTLGPLIKRFVEDVIAQDGAERGMSATDDQTDVISFSFRLNIAMSAEDIALTTRGLQELITLRNTLVHHFLERFNLWQVDGCIQAQAYLEDCYGCIDSHYEELRAWAAHVEAARQQTATFMQTPQFINLLLNGIAPDGSVDWNVAGCISILRAAETTLATDGWAPVTAAAKWIAEHHPDQTPEKYGCRRWNQVLQDSRQFEILYRLEEGHRVPWFRSRSKKTPAPRMPV